MNRRGTVFFCYAKPEGFSGQMSATLLVRDGLARRGWRCRELPMPVYERGTGWAAPLRYAVQVGKVWMQAVRLLFAADARLWVGMGQTRVSFLRDFVPLLFGFLGAGRDHVVVSLNGSLFMRWSDSSADAWLFRRLTELAGAVTVVGDRQRERLLRLGVPPERAVVVVNSCALPPLSAAELESKLSRGAEAPVRCLFLSSLIDTKGYPEYLQALLRLAAIPGPRIEAVLCGRLVASDFSARFGDAREAEAWINACLADTGRSGRVSVRWIKGATGAPKEELFRQADVFVLPTRYAVEAQPLVLLEAMAAGCAIITTAIAEIPTILSSDCALLLREGDEKSVADAMQLLVESPGQRAALARTAHGRFCRHYQPDQHLDAWERLLRRARGASGSA